MDESSGIDHLLAGGAGNIDLVVLDPMAVHPERERAERPLFRKVFRDPGAMGVQDLGEVLHERGKKPFACLHGRALKDGAQGRVSFEAQQRQRSVSGAVWHSYLRRY